MAKRKTKAKKQVEEKTGKGIQKANQKVAVAALLLNLLTVPGLGSLIAGRSKVATTQISLAVLGLLFIVFRVYIIGIPIFVIAWILGIMTSVDLIRSS